MISIYIHIPFCARRCAYCDFNTYAGENRLIPEYVRALKAEIRAVAGAADEMTPVHTVFFGGGTPSLFSPNQVAEILDELQNRLRFQNDIEITMEVNPGTITRASLSEFREMGVNRLSIGAQSFRNEELRLLGRIHDTMDIRNGCKWARQAGYDNLNLDLIFGLPGQTLDHWRQSLDLALDLNPEHLSLYGLTIEEGTPLHRWVDRGLVSVPDDDLSADMYEYATDRLEAAGFAQYEISNWARADENRDHRCKHNLQYWHNLPYLGFGAGAHGYIQGVRTENVRGIREYIGKMKVKSSPLVFPISPANVRIEEIDLETEIKETMMVGMRLTQEGVNRERFKQRFGADLVSLYKTQIDQLIREGLIELSENICLTKQGRLLGNRVFAQFVNATLPKI